MDVPDPPGGRRGTLAVSWRCGAGPGAAPGADGAGRGHLPHGGGRRPGYPGTPSSGLHQRRPPRPR
eukprot:100779-Pyramimonas_sp.AAC.1